MSDKTTEKPAAADKITMLALRQVTFDRSITVPGAGMRTGTGTGDPAGKTWRIDLELRLRAVRIRYVPPSHKDFEGEVWIPLERIVSWELA